MAGGRYTRYVQFYSGGTEAVKLEPKKKKPVKKVPRPRARKRPVVTIPVDPLSWTAVAVSAVLILCLFAGLFQFQSLQQQRNDLSAYVSRLEQEQKALRQTYKDGYDLDQVLEQALAMGMVPVEQLETVKIHVPPAEPAPVEPTWWERVVQFFTQLFA